MCLPWWPTEKQVTSPQRLSILTRKCTKVWSVFREEKIKSETIRNLSCSARGGVNGKFITAGCRAEECCLPLGKAAWERSGWDHKGKMTKRPWSGVFTSRHRETNPNMPCPRDVVGQDFASCTFNKQRDPVLLPQVTWKWVRLILKNPKPSIIFCKSACKHR